MNPDDMDRADATWGKSLLRPHINAIAASYHLVSTCLSHLNCFAFHFRFALCQTTGTAAFRANVLKISKTDKIETY